MNRRLPLQMIIRLVGTVLSLVVGIIIIYFSLTVSSLVPQWTWIPFADKGSHMVAYAAFGFSLFPAFLHIPGSGGRQHRRPEPLHSTLHLTSWSGVAIMKALCCGSLFGGLLELLQPLFGRSRDWFDFMADFMGLAVGIAISLLLLKCIGGYFSTRPWLYDPNWKENEHEIVG